MSYPFTALLVVAIAIASYRMVIVFTKGDDRSLSVLLQMMFSASALAMLLWLAKLAIDITTIYGNYQPNHTFAYWFEYAGVPAILGGVAAFVVARRQMRPKPRPSRG